VAALGSFDPTTRTVTALVGRGASSLHGSPNVTAPAPPELVTLHIVVPWSTGTVRVFETAIAGQHTTTAERPGATSSSVAAIVAMPGGKGGVTVRIPAFADGDAYAVTLARTA
jgi:hypothetical protein